MSGKDWQITNYYEKIRQGKQEKLFHEVIFQIGNREDMAVGAEEGNLVVKVLGEYVKYFQKRNPTLRVFNESSKSPASIAKSNKQWVGTCLYQEWYKPLLINCGAVIRL